MHASGACDLGSIPSTPTVKWNFSLLAENEQELEKARVGSQRACEEFASAWGSRSDYLQDPAVLKQALDEYERLMASHGCNGLEEYYFSLKSALSQDDPDITARLNLAQHLARTLWGSVQFFPLRLATIPKETQERLLSSPDLSPYAYFLSRVFELARYNLGEEAEKALMMKGGPAREYWAAMLSAFLSREEAEVLLEDGRRSTKVFAELFPLLEHESKTVRDSAAGEINAILLKHSDVAEREINALLADKQITDELRGMDRSDLARHLDDGIETGVVDALLEAVSKEFELSSRFYALKARLLGLPTIVYHERSAPVGRIEKEYSYDEALSLLRGVFAGLDGEFGEIFSSLTERGHVDAYPAKGKQGGAFCTHRLLSHPTYILLNFSGTLESVLTFAHEMGHAINNELMRKRQHALYFETSLATAEVASTFMEEFALEAAMNDMNEETRLAVLVKKLNGDVSSIFRQVACYRFEQELHDRFRSKGYLSKETIGGIFQRHMAAYMGASVEQSRGSEHWWVHWSHIRRHFYVYSYASGLLISKSLQNATRRDPAFVSRVKEFLSAGASSSPEDIFSRLGISIDDPAFWRQGIQSVKDDLARAEDLAKKLGKI